MILDGEDDFVNMLRHVLGVLGMTSEVVRHEDVRRRATRRLDLVIVGRARATRATATTSRSRHSGGGRRAARSRSGRSSRSASATRCCATGSGSPGLQGHRLPGHPVAGRASTAAPSGSASTTPSSAGPADRLPDGRHGRDRPGDRRHPPRRGPALPRHPVPRRVDPHRARLRPAARPGPATCSAEPTPLTELAHPGRRNVRGVPVITPQGTLVTRQPPGQLGRRPPVALEGDLDGTRAARCRR